MKYLITFSYDGTNYVGYQKQNNGETIQEKIELALTKLNKKPVIIHASGRTDALVHAISQTAHFELDVNIPLNKIKIALNSLLPKDIYIKQVKKVSNEFHARYDIKRKEYNYYINTGEYNLFDRNYIYQYNKILDVKKMKQALKIFLGEHDFKSFTKENKEITNYNRTIYKARIKDNNNQIVIILEGNGFLRYMVRNIVGTLIKVGENKITVEEVKQILEAKDRKLAFDTAPAAGLYLKKVTY